MAISYNYSLSNFLSTPSPDDVRIRIYEKSGKLRYTVDPKISHFFTNSNKVIIKTEGRNDVVLDFPNSVESVQALSRLNEAKQIISRFSCDIKPTPSAKDTVYSKSNLNMLATVTENDGDLACDSPIIDKPKSNSYVRVFINGLEVNVGGKEHPYDCYFSGDDGVSVRSLGSELQGDMLYWNPSVAGYNLDEVDLIDFVYLMNF